MSVFWLFFHVSGYSLTATPFQSFLSFIFVSFNCSFTRQFLPSPTDSCSTQFPLLLFFHATYPLLHLSSFSFYFRLLCPSLWLSSFPAFILFSLLLSVLFLRFVSSYFSSFYFSFILISLSFICSSLQFPLFYPFFYFASYMHITFLVSVFFLVSVSSSLSITATPSMSFFYFDFLLCALCSRS